MGMVEVKLVDNSAALLRATREAVYESLENIGKTMERHAKEKCPVDTGRLKNSISHIVVDTTVYVGTNVEYAPYLEAGTGIYADEGGRKTPWSYMDTHGEWHTTQGVRPHHFLRDAAANHPDEYRRILKSTLQQLQNV